MAGAAASRYTASVFKPPVAMHRVLLVPLALLLALTVQAQPARFSIGPQLSTLGIGLSGSYRLHRNLSVSAEANILPLGTVEFEEDDLSYEGDGQASGGLLLVNLHPGGGNFSVGAGLFVGGYELDGTATPSEPVELGGQTYLPGEVGNVVGEFWARGPVPIFMLGWRGRGFNFGVGVTTGYDARAELTVTGPAATRQDVRESVAREQQNIEDGFKKVPVIPYLRIGWQFGF